jgi:5-methylcytosine-specific restriction endonuclease McrA
MSDYGLGPKPNFLESNDYQAIWRDSAGGRYKRNARAGLLSESGEHPDDLRQLPYWQYLRTAHWAAVRHRALAVAEHRCFYCSATDHLDVHHLSYKRRGCELDEDLIVLCRTCHDIEHQSSDEIAAQAAARLAP